ncbi:uncharacterized protein ACB058_006828 [Synchiropus picturatus]
MRTPLQLWMLLCLATGGSARALDGSLLRDSAGSEGHRCSELAAPWLESSEPPRDGAAGLRLRLRPWAPGASRGAVFPGKSLFSFVRRVYHCCQRGGGCRSLKGLQGRRRGDSDVEFLLTGEIYSMTVVRAELHLQLSNPHHLEIRPSLPAMAKRNLPTRYNSGSRDNSVDLRVDLLFLFQNLQEAAGLEGGGGHGLVHIRQDPSRRPVLGKQSSEGPVEDPAADVWRELGLALNCSLNGDEVSCQTSGVHLLHAPFIALYYA